MQNICDTKFLHLHKNLQFAHECSRRIQFHSHDVSFRYVMKDTMFVALNFFFFLGGERGVGEREIWYHYASMVCRILIQTNFCRDCKKIFINRFLFFERLCVCVYVSFHFCVARRIRLRIFFHSILAVRWNLNVK